MPACILSPFAVSFTMKTAITSEDHRCRRCGGEVTRQQHAKGWQPKPGRTWFRWWFKCVVCRTVCMVEAARVVEPMVEHPELFAVTPKESPESYANRIYESNRLEFTEPPKS